jgi:hypothetical protein
MWPAIPGCLDKAGFLYCTTRLDDASATPDSISPHHLARRFDVLRDKFHINPDVFYTQTIEEASLCRKSDPQHLKFCIKR